MQTALKPSIELNSIHPINNNRAVKPVRDDYAKIAKYRNVAQTRNNIAIIITMVLAIISVCSLFALTTLICVACGASLLTSIIVCGIVMIILGVAAWLCVEYVAYRIRR